MGGTCPICGTCGMGGGAYAGICICGMGANVCAGAGAAACCGGAPPFIACSRMREASRIRVNSLGPVATGEADGAAGSIGGCQLCGLAAGAGGAAEDSEANVCVHTPGPPCATAGAGALGTAGVSCRTGASSIWISRVIPTPAAGVDSTGCAAGAASWKNESFSEPGPACAGAGAFGVNP